MKVLLRLFRPIVKFREILWSVELKHSKTPARDFSLTQQRNYTQNSDWGSKKAHRKVKLKLFERKEMADPKIEEVLAPLRQRVKEQVS